MLCYSTGSLPDVSFSELFKIIKSTIFTGIEVVITPNWLSQWNDFDFWNKVYSDSVENGLTLRSVHMGHPFLVSNTPHHPGLACPNIEDREIKLKAILQSVEIAKKLNKNEKELEAESLKIFLECSYARILNLILFLIISSVF